MGWRFWWGEVFLRYDGRRLQMIYADNIFVYFCHGAAEAQRNLSTDLADFHGFIIRGRNILFKPLIHANSREYKLGDGRQETEGNRCCCATFFDIF